MKLRKLARANRRIFDGFLSARPHELSAYTFAAIFIWQELYEIRWAISCGALCVFFRDRTGSFLFLPPLEERTRLAASHEAFGLMRRLNGENRVSRIENIEHSRRQEYVAAGFSCIEKFGEYLCARSDLVRLRGNAFKAKRAAYNYFVRHYAGQYRAYRASDRQECLRLYAEWMQERRKRFVDPVYRGMLEDSLSCLKVLLASPEKLGVIGRVVTLSGVIRGFTFGCPISRESLCVLFEVTDLSVKGLAQFIFRQLCAECSTYHTINVMDDSGLENLRRVKQSYRPIRLVPAFVAYPPYGPGN